MSKELIERLRSHVTPAIYSQDVNAMHQAANLIEQLQREIERKMSAGDYVLEQLAAAQAQHAACLDELHDIAVALGTDEGHSSVYWIERMRDDFAAALAREAKLREAISSLWDIIDDIDTYGDMAKSDNAAFRSMVERRQKDRWKTGITTDGYSLNLEALAQTEVK